ncbi:hypothetical protein YB2330_006436 [Saitoella coloradoensis]
MSKNSDFAPPEEEINWDEDPTPAPSAAIVTEPSVTTGDDLSAETAVGTTDAQPAPEPSLEKVEAEGAKPDLSEDKATPAANPKPKTITKESGFTFKRLGASFDTTSSKPSTSATTTAAPAAAAPATTEKDDAEAKRLAAEEEKRKRREARFGVVEKPAPKAPKEKTAPVAAAPKPAPTKAVPAAAAAKKDVKQTPAAEKRKAELDPAELEKARKRAERFGVKKTDEKVATSGEGEKKVEEVAEKVEGQ